MALTWCDCCLGSVSFDSGYIGADSYHLLRIRYETGEAQTEKVPYTLILGDQEKENSTISYRLFGQKDTTTVSKEEFVNLIKEEIDTKALRK